MAGIASFDAFVAGFERDAIADLRVVYRVPARLPADRLSAWLSSFDGLIGVVDLLDGFEGPLLEAMLVLGPGRRREQIEAVIDGRAAEDQVDAALLNLTRLALVWPIGDGRWGLNPGLPEVMGLPCGLGPPAELLLPHATVAQLQQAARFFGVPPMPLKAGLLDQVTELFVDPDRVREAVARLSAPARKLMQGLADPGGVLRLGWNTRPPAGGDELIGLALVVVVNYDTGLVPAEVALALRGGRILLAVTPEPPTVGELVAGDVGGRTTEAVAGAVSDLGRLLSAVSIRPLTQLASGGLGAKEVKRLARELAISEERARLLLCLSEDVEALVADAGTVIERPGSTFAALPPAEQWMELATLFLAGSHADRVPFGRRDTGASAGLPFALVLTMAPPERRLSEADFDALLAWRLPRARFAGAGHVALVVMQDAAELGLVVAGVVTDLVDLVIRDRPAALAAVTGMLPERVDEIILQADLTATATGPPGPALARLLDGAAESETSGHASVWRFTPASVRRYLGDGGDADELSARLTAAAPRGVPGTLSQLIADATRRHGEVVIRTAVSVLVARDEVIAATLLGDRRLAKLRLAQVAPTVLIAALAEDAVLDAVRRAGYAPSVLGAGPQVIGPDLEKLVKAALRQAQRGTTATLLTAARDGSPVTVSAWDSGDYVEVELSSPRLDSTYLTGRAPDGRGRRFKLAGIFTARV